MGPAKPWITWAVLPAVVFAARAFAVEPDATPKRVVPPHSDPAFPLAQPIFPVESLMLRHDGIVSLIVLADVDGSVVDQRVVVSTGHAELDAAALDITKSWKLKPGTVNGVPTKMWGYFSITFKVNGKPTPTLTDQHRAAAKLMADQQAKMEAAAAAAATPDEQAGEQTDQSK